MLKYSVGLDIAAKKIDCCISAIDAAQHVSVKASCVIENTMAGFKQLNLWIEKHRKQKEIPLVAHMEATGVYYENCALFLHQKGYYVIVSLPNKSKKWMEAEGIKSKNDKIDARGLSKMGAEKALGQWQPAAEFYYRLRLMTRQHQHLQEQRTEVNNRLHADGCNMYPEKMITKQIKRHIELIDNQLSELITSIEEHLSSDKDVAGKVENICKIKGLGMLTVAVILAETNGFALFKNIPQLVSYAGYDVQENQSGPRVGRTKISKKGNSRIRRILHMPAFNMVRYAQKPFLDLFERTFEKHKIKMKSYVAVQKKLLVMIFTLWKKNEAYNPDFGKEHTKEQEQALPLGSASAEAVTGNTESIKKEVAQPKEGLHKVNIPGERSQYASSRLVQSYGKKPKKAKKVQECDATEVDRCYQA
jgi:transposase